MARSMVRALLLSAAVFSSNAALTAPKQSVLRLPKRYHTATEFTAYSPSTTSATSALPLVLMLSGYCLPAQLQDDVRLRTIHPQVPQARRSLTTARRPRVGARRFSSATRTL